MNHFEIEFTFDSSEKVIIDLKIPLNEVDCCYRDPVFFINKQKKIMLSNDTVETDVRYLKNFLQKCLNNELSLHESIKDDIGHVYNEYYQNKTQFITDYINGINTWIGYKYQLWQAYKNKKRFITWMYNDSNNDIIFEVTPFYPYLFCEPKEEPHYVSYNEWIKDYKPYFVTKISKEIAQQWLEKAADIIEQIDSNVARWKSELR